MVIDSMKIFEQPDNFGSVYCKPWGGCRDADYAASLPYGAPAYVEDIIGATAFTLSDIFGKGRGQWNQPGYFNINQYMPLILLGGAAILMVSFMKK